MSDLSQPDNVQKAHSFVKCQMHTQRDYPAWMKFAELHKRLAWARETAGYETARAGAERTGIKYSLYAQHENGIRGFRSDKAEIYAKAYRVDVRWLLYGTGNARPKQVDTVPIIGRVGADPSGEIVFSTADPTGDVAPLPIAGTPDAVALEVVGHSFRGFADDGSLIYFEEQRTPPTADMIGYPVVVETESGLVLLKRLLRGSKSGLYDLESINGPTLTDQRLRWAAEITCIIPARQARKIIIRGSERAA